MKRYLTIENIFLLIILLAGMLFAIINPFGQEPDGWVHFTRAVDVSYGNVMAPLRDNNGHSEWFILPLNIMDLNFHVIETGKHEAIQYMNDIKNFYFCEETTPMEGLGGFTSFFYWPQAIGICIARGLGLSAYGYMVSGRICNLLIYAVLTYVGIKKMPVFKLIYMMIAMLPITVYQAASFSYDAMLNGLCFLFIAMCFECAYEREFLSWKYIIPLGVILGLISWCKYVYVCIGLLVFIIPEKKFKDISSYWKAFVTALLPFVFMFSVMLYSTSIVTVVVEGNSGVLGGEQTQLEYVLQNPIVLIKVFGITISKNFSMYIDQINILGWLNFDLKPLRYIIPGFVSIVALLDTKVDTSKIKIKDKWIFFNTFLVTVVLGMLGLYLMDSVSNPVGSKIITGYQGRYTLPVLMLLLILLANTKVENKIDKFSTKVIGIMSIFLMLSVICLVVLCY